MLHTLISTTTDPSVNLATEQWLYDYGPETVLMFYRNTSSVIIGKYQNPWAEADVPWLESEAVPVLRRISAGGTVYHDPGNLNVSLIQTKRAGENYDIGKLTTPLVEAISGLGLQVSVGQRNDLRIGNRKICGTAIAQRPLRSLLHGCLLVQTDLERLHAALRPCITVHSGRGMTSVSSHVTNLSQLLNEPISMEALISLIIDSFTAVYGPAEMYAINSEAQSDIQHLVRERYHSWQWNFGTTPTFSTALQAGKLCPEGAIATVKQGRVTGLQPNEYGLAHPFLGRRFDPEFIR